MLPLHPPTSTSVPGYPARQRLLADPRLRRHALTVLAAAALAGCAETAHSPAVPEPVRQVDTKTMETLTDAVIYDEDREPKDLEPSVTLRKSTEPDLPDSTSVLGEDAAPEPPEPHLIMGMMIMPRPIPEIQIPEENVGPDADV